MLKKLTKIGFFCAAFGVLGLVIILIAGPALSNVVFNLLAACSLFLIFAALPFMAASWMLTIHREIKGKHYLIAALWGLLGLVLILRALWRIL